MDVAPPDVIRQSHDFYDGPVAADLYYREISRHSPTEVPMLVSSFIRRVLLTGLAGAAALIAPSTLEAIQPIFLL